MQDKDALGEMPPPPGADGNARVGKNMWTEEETQALVDGCNKHGIGSWKQILSDEQFAHLFDNRTAGDLKDRFRTYFPDTYHEMYPNAKTHWGYQARGRTSSGRSIFERGKAKERRPFSASEDAALLRGYQEHGSNWALISRDPAFQKQRRSTDVRDRFRNAFPEDYERAGYKPRTKSSAKDREVKQESADDVQRPGPSHAHTTDSNALLMRQQRPTHARVSSIPSVRSMPSIKQMGMPRAAQLPADEMMPATSHHGPAASFDFSYLAQNALPTSVSYDNMNIDTAGVQTTQNTQRFGSAARTAAPSRFMQRSRSSGSIYKRRSNTSRENPHSVSTASTMNAPLSRRMSSSHTCTSPKRNKQPNAMQPNLLTPPLSTGNVWFETTDPDLFSPLQAGQETNAEFLTQLGGLSLFPELPSAAPIKIPAPSGSAYDPPMQTFMSRSLSSHPSTSTTTSGSHAWADATTESDFSPQSNVEAQNARKDYGAAQLFGSVPDNAAQAQVATFGSQHSTAPSHGAASMNTPNYTPHFPHAALSSADMYAGTAAVPNPMLTYPFFDACSDPIFQTMPEPDVALGLSSNPSFHPGFARDV